MLRNALLRLVRQAAAGSSKSCVSQPASCLQHTFLPSAILLRASAVGSNAIPESLKRSFTTCLVVPAICRPAGLLNHNNTNSSSLLRVTSTINEQPSRTVIRCSMNKGKKKTVKAVVSRFYRFSNGLWLRRYAGYKKKLHKKSLNRKRRIKNHIFCNRTQSKMLDLMVTRYWKERKYYVDHPYEKYQDRNFNGFKTWPGKKIAHANYERVSKHGYRMKEI